MNRITPQPHLIVIGAQKAGTTWLQHLFDCNEQFWCPPYQEIHFFDREFNKEGLDYYFSLYKEAPSSKITCDVTPNYLSHPLAPERIYYFSQRSARPIKFIFIGREPISRLISAYKMKIRKQKEKGKQKVLSLEEALELDKNLINNSLYYTNLNNYLNYFSLENFEILIQEELKDNKKYNLHKIERFLGLENPIVDYYENSIINLGGLRKSYSLTKLQRNGGKLLRGLKMTSLVHKIKRSEIIKIINKQNYQPFDCQFTEKELLKLKELERDIFYKEVENLSILLNKPDLLNLWGYN